ncbi:MAG: 1,4-dihydroxy-6-naphthoate synthase [Nitrospirota bacterium]|nr:1,4-dihydroxy-6-naphthoate synthase [Nitrospirota bacterium]MDH5767902.1 1,4-dihydroxy-6-naphthoate synthase [Nitrospirota bacterium]
MITKPISLGYSPCPNDTFIFYALVHGKIDTGGMHFKEILLDVETLNQMALHKELDITKVSYHAFGYLLEDYCLLRSGSAIGRSGPLIVAREDYTVRDLQGKKIAIPGKLTTAYLLLQLFTSDLVRKGDFVPLAKSPSEERELQRNCTFPCTCIDMPFHKIMENVRNKDVDAGLIIHEGRFTYPLYGLKKVIDLGEWWENETGLPVPLGGILVKRNLGGDLIKKISSFVRKSVEHAFAHSDESKNYIKLHSQELEDKVIEQHINLYVNDYSIDIGEDGISAVKELLRRAEERGIIKKSKEDFLCTM